MSVIGERTNLSWNHDASGFADARSGRALPAPADAIDERLFRYPGFQIRGNSLRLNNRVGKGTKFGEIARW